MKKYNNEYYLTQKLRPFYKAVKKTIYLPEGEEIHEKAQTYIDLLIDKFKYQIQYQIECKNYEVIYLSRSLAIAGKGVSFLNHKFFNLIPGTKVKSIGSGKATGSNHVDKFSKEYEYAGAILINDNKYYAFKLPEEVRPLKDRDFYMLYWKDRYTIYREVYKTDKTYDYTRIFKPTFKIIDN
ncbi:hypothetical protein [Flavobacterium sp. HNIBRBA15423]|uniref:hypothetical protein n=1 Tax=Flavobacterium sp. HNIBRBA15423 TaxID=3458683 RepID=UPI0040444051